MMILVLMMMMKTIKLRRRVRFPAPVSIRILKQFIKIIIMIITVISIIIIIIILSAPVSIKMVFSQFILSITIWLKSTIGSNLCNIYSTILHHRSLKILTISFSIFITIIPSRLKTSSSIPEGNPLMKSNILDGRGNPHRRHHHHVCPGEVLLIIVIIMK